MNILEIVWSVVACLNILLTENTSPQRIKDLSGSNGHNLKKIYQKYNRLTSDVCYTLVFQSSNNAFKVIRFSFF